MATPDAAPLQTSRKPSSRMAQPFRAIGSIHQSPSNHSTTGTGGHTLTLSSLPGDYIHLSVQVTRDLHPVLYNKWRLPISGFDLSVSDVTLDQLKAAVPRGGSISGNRASSPSEWHKVLSSSLLPLQEAIRVGFDYAATLATRPKLRNHYRTFLRLSAYTSTLPSLLVPRGSGICSPTVICLP